MGIIEKLIFENQSGKMARTIVWNRQSLNVILRHDTNRIEIHSNLSQYDSEKIEYTLLRQVSPTELMNPSGVIIPKVGKLRPINQWDVGPSDFELPPENEKDTPLALKWSAMAHFFILLLLVGLTFILRPVEKSVDSVVITVPPPVVKDVSPKVEKVKVSETKIESKKIPKKVKVVSHPVIKSKPKKIVQHKILKSILRPRSSHPQHTVLSKTAQPTTENIGALGVLGGLNKGVRGAQGLDLNSMKNIRSAGVGQGGGGVGFGRGGGIRTVLPGGGIIAGSAGSGGMAGSAGGYGTHGIGGGKAGYGKVKLVGGTSGISMPIEEDAIVQGGLDKDQIAAVINKNMGQIVYCYEKGLQSEPTLRGRVGIKFIINGRGIVATAKIPHSSLNSASVEGCILNKLKAWKFPQPVGGVNVDVFYPFDFGRVSQNL